MSKMSVYQLFVFYHMPVCSSIHLWCGVLPSVSLTICFDSHKDCIILINLCGAASMLSICPLTVAVLCTVFAEQQIMLIL